MRPAPWTQLTTFYAAGGYLDCLRYARSKGAPWNPNTTVNASRGHYECLRFACEDGCPWHDDAMKEAAHHGHMDCLVYGWTHGASCDQHTVTAAARGDSEESLRFLLENGCRFSGSDVHVQRHSGLVVECMARRGAALVIQRTWRARKEAAERRAVCIIEDAYILWVLPPWGGGVVPAVLADLPARGGDRRVNTEAATHSDLHSSLS